MVIQKGDTTIILPVNYMPVIDNKWLIKKGLIHKKTVDNGCYKWWTLLPFVERSYIIFKQTRQFLQRNGTWYEVIDKLERRNHV